MGCFRGIRYPPATDLAGGRSPNVVSDHWSGVAHHNHTLPTSSNEASQVTYEGEKDYTTSNVRQLSHESDKEMRDEKTKKQMKDAADGSHASCWLCHDPIFITLSWFTAPRGLTLTMGSRPDYWRKDLLYGGGEIERNAGPKRAVPARGDALPTAAQRYDVAVTEFQECMRVEDIHEL